MTLQSASISQPRAAPAALHPQATSIAPTLARALLLLSLASFTVAWFAALGSRALISPDEGRYATIAWEMAHSGDWISPRLNGLLYFEKPPLQYWIGAIFFELFGHTVFAARLWPALASFLTVLMVGFTGARLWGRDAGLRAFAVAAATTWIFANGHFLTLDAGLTLFLTVALGAVLIAEYGQLGTRRRTWIWLAWAAMAGAVLSKGLVGILIPGAVLVIASVWRRDFRLWRGMHWLSGLVLFFVLAAPWFVLVSMRNPSFAHFFFIHEHFERYLTTVHERTGGWWYYLPLLVLGLLPWTGALPWLRPRAEHRGRRGALMPVDILVVWSAFVLLFFSVSGSKLPSYILPMFPALALMIGLRLGDASPRALRLHLLLPAGLWLLALIASTQVERIAAWVGIVEELAPVGEAIRIGAAVFLTTAAFAWWSIGQRRTTAALLSLALGQVIGMTIVLQAHDFGRSRSAAAMASLLEPRIARDTPVFALRSYDQTLPFYLERDITLVDYYDEFALGQTIEPERSINSIDDFIARWKALPQAAAYMDFSSFVELQQRRLPMRIVFHDRRRVLVVKH